MSIRKKPIKSFQVGKMYAFLTIEDRRPMSVTVKGQKYRLKTKKGKTEDMEIFIFNGVEVEA